VVCHSIGAECCIRWRIELMSGNARKEHAVSFVQANRIVLIGTVDELCK
jgi:hypothetical protein